MICRPGQAMVVNNPDYVLLGKELVNKSFYHPDHFAGPGSAGHFGICIYLALPDNEIEEQPPFGKRRKIRMNAEIVHIYNRGDNC